MQIVDFQQQINIAKQKVTGVLNVGNFKSVNFGKKLKDFEASDRAFSFMNTIKGTLTHWKRFKSEVLAMVRKSEIPVILSIVLCRY